MLAALVGPCAALVNVLADLTTQKGALEFCGKNVTLLPCVTTTKPGPVGATLGLEVPNQIRRHATSPKLAHRMNTLNLRLI